jgi:formylglycine-generating enzyme required for sulfatase activity
MRRAIAVVSVPVALAAGSSSLLFLLACFPSYEFAAGSSANQDGGGDARADAPDQVAPDGGGGTDSGAGADGGGDAAPIDAGPFDASGSVRIEGGTMIADPGTGAGASLSHAFFLDKFEVTVARFKGWIAAGKPAPCNSGTCSVDIPGGPYEARMKWSSTWNGAASFTKAGWDDPGTCIAGIAGTSPELHFRKADDLPINCVTWFQAVAFCAWDGGKRLPTWYEWTRAARGANGQRIYPWGNIPPDCTHAIYGRTDTFGGCGFADRPGVTVAGVTPEGIFDMGGNVFERTFDYLPGALSLDAGVDPLGPACSKPVDEYEECTAVRGGGWNRPEADVANEYSRAIDKGEWFDGTGFRCARTAP